jgi:CRP/FNR family transcriptional regulator, cyclic AMP receptor protein
MFRRSRAQDGPGGTRHLPGWSNGGQPWEHHVAVVHERDGVMRGRTIEPLRASHLFCSLDDDALVRLALCAARRRYRADEVIFHAGDPGDRLHVIDRGRVRIAIQSADGREGTLSILGPGEAFGELALLDGDPRSATAITMEASETVTLDRVAFEALLDADRSMRRAVHAGLGRWLRRLTEQVADLHFLDVRGRVAATLVRLARETAPASERMVELPALTQSDLASLVASTRQRVNQTLADLVRDGLISQDGRRITVVDVARLAELASR